MAMQSAPKRYTRAMSRQGKLLVLLGAGLVLVFLLHVGIGSTLWFKPWSVVAELLRGPMADATADNSIIWQIRLPRAVLALCVGVSLGVVGSAFQAQLRNSLADPYIVGVSSGAAVGGVTALVTGVGTAFGGVGTMLAGFITGMASLALVYALSRRKGFVEVTALLLSGVAIGALLSALTSLVLLMAGQDTNRVLQWLLGYLGAASWPQIAVLAVGTVSGSIVMILNTKVMNVFATGESTASRLGIDVPRFRSLILATGTAMTAASVGAVGIIGFLGLVAPHIARRIVGVDWRFSLPASGLIGGILLLASDLIAQRGVSLVTNTVGMELPVGIVTAVLGAPSLLVLLRRTAR
ncbi:iron ABC transporter permease [soil metagenome]